MIYRFRVILDAKEDIFRDIEIESSATAEDFHNAITQAFGFGGQEMACFYISDSDWNQGEEISLFDMSEGPDAPRIMATSLLKDLVDDVQTRMIYVYDFLSMWTFLVELAEIAEPETGRIYPNLMFAHGDLPEEAPEKEFVGESLDDNDFGEDLDVDIDDLDFDQNWN